MYHISAYAIQITRDSQVFSGTHLGAMAAEDSGPVHLSFLAEK